MLPLGANLFNQTLPFLLIISHKGEIMLVFDQLVSLTFNIQKCILIIKHQSIDKYS